MAFNIFIKHKINLNFIIVSLVVLVSLRYHIGNDYDTYCDIYQLAPSLKNFSLYQLFVIEPGFYLANILFKYFDLNIAFLFAFFSFLSLYVFVYAVNRIDNKILPFSLFIYFSFFFFSFQFNIIRHGIMASFVFLAFTYIKERKVAKYMLFIVCGALFHYNAFVFIPFYFLLGKEYSTKMISILLVIAVVLFFFPVFNILLMLFGHFPYIGDKLFYYINVYSLVSKSYGITIGMIFNLFIVLVNYFIIYKNKVEGNSLEYFKIYNNLLFLGVLLSLIFNEYTVFVERCVSICNMSLIVLIPYYYYYYFNNVANKIISVVILLIYLNLIFYVNLHVLRSDGEYQFMPYKTILEK